MSRTTPMRTRLVTPDPAGVAEAAAILRAGRLVAFPTETVYGLGADATSGTASARIYDAKGRPRFNPLIAHLADSAQAMAEGRFDRYAAALAEAFWPGPLTLVVPASAACRVCDLARAGLPSVALRVPGHPVARALIEAAGFPVVAPSANRSGRISPTEPRHVMADLDGRIELVIDGGPTRVGLESTIVACLGEPIVLRPGGIARADLEAVLGAPIALIHAGSDITAPGMLASHYAPQATLRLDAISVRRDEAVLDFAGQLAGQGATPYLDLSPRGDLAEAAAHLFTFLRRLDTQAPAIAIAPIPSVGLGEAITDRLARAAAPRPGQYTSPNDPLGSPHTNLL